MAQLNGYWWQDPLYIQNKNRVSTPVMNPSITVNPEITSGGSITKQKKGINLGGIFSSFLGNNKSDAWKSLAGSTSEYKDDVIGYMNSKNRFGISKAANPFSKGNLKSGASAGLIGAAAGMVNALGNKFISDGYKDKVGQGIATVGGAAGSMVGQFNPLLGGIITAGSGILGGLAQRTFGIKTNTKALNTARGNMSRALQYQGNASSFDNVKEAPTMQAHSTIYKGGWASTAKDRARARNNRIINHESYAANKARNEMLNNVAVLNHKQTNNMLANYSALGGPIVNMVNGPTDFWLASQQLALQNKAIDNKNKPAQLPNSFTNINAFGGDLQTHGADWSTGFSHVKKGGTHEENPKGGVTVGHDAQGVPNMVEEGEIIANTKEFGGKVVKDYVFSDRLKVPEYSKEHKGEELPYEMKVLKKYEGKTFAEGGKMIEKNSGVDERPNDVMAQNMAASDAFYLMQAQEKERMKKMLSELMEQIDNLPPEQAQAALMQVAQMMQQAQGQQGEQLQQIPQEEAQQQAVQQEAPMEQGLPQQEMMSQEQMPEEQYIPQEQVPQEEVPQEEPYTGEGYSMSPEEEALLAQQQQEVPVQQADGGPINKFHDGGVISRENYGQLAKAMGITDQSLINDLYANVPNDVLGAIKNLQQFATVVNPTTLLSYIQPKAVEEFKKQYAKLDAEAQKQYGTMNLALNPKPEGERPSLTDYATRKWLIDKKGWSEEQAKSETYQSQASKGNRQYIDRYMRKMSNDKDFLKELNYGDKKSFLDAYAQAQAKVADDADKYDRYKKLESRIQWNDLQNKNLSIEQIKGLNTAMFGEESTNTSFKNVTDAATAFRRFRSNVEGNETINNPKALFEAIERYNSGVTEGGIPKGLSRIDDLSKLQYLGGLDNPENYDVNSLTWGDRTHDQLLTESVKGKDGKNYIRYKPWADPKTGKFKFEGKDYTPMEYENTDNYSKPRWQLLSNLYKAKQEQGDKFNFKEFVQKDPLWSRFMGSMQDVYSKNYKTNYIDDYGDRLSDFNQLLGNVTPEQLKNWFGENGDYNSFIQFIRGRKNPIKGSLFYDAQTAMNHPSWKTSALQKPGSRDVYYTVDSNGKRTYYNYGPWNSEWDKIIKRVGERGLLNDLTDEKGNTTYGQQIDFLPQGSPIDIEDWRQRRKYLEEHDKEGYDKLNKHNEMSNFPQMPLWPFYTGLALQLGALGYNIANPLDTSQMDELAAYSRQSHYLEPKASFVPGYQPYRPINSRALTEPMTGAALAANRQFRNMSAGNYGQAMAHIGNQTNSYLDKIGQSYLQAEAQDRAHQGDVFKNNFMVNQANAEHNANMAKAASDAFSKAGNEAIAGLSAAYKYKQEAEKERGAAISGGLTGIANLANSYAQQQYNNAILGWGAEHNAWGPGVFMQNPHATAYGGPVRRSVRRSLI